MPTIDPSSNCHTAQWERQSTWLAHLREQKQKLQASGVNGFDLLEAMATLSIHHKLATCTKDRCETCWHAKLYCICGQLKQIVFKQEHEVVPNVKMLILMHHKEYMSAGNSAKLLLQLFPLSTELYIFGKEGDVNRLFQDITSKQEVIKPIILWPGKEAMSTAELLCSLKDEQSTTSYSHATNNHTFPTIHAIVLDGTYNQARNMYKSLKKKWRHTNNIPTAVSLQPISESVFHRAQKNYGKAHLQHQGIKNEDTVLRVCTAEACGVLLHELGVGDQDLVERVMDAVRLNNDALKYSRHHLTNC